MTERKKIKKILEPYDINSVPEANGLANQSATMCYHNSLMQCLFSLPSVRKTLDTAKDTNVLASIFSELWSAYEKKQPTDDINRKMWQAIIETSNKRSDCMKFNQGQQDANEGFMLFLSVFEKSIPDLYNLFTLSYEQHIGCKKCNAIKKIQQQDSTIVNANLVLHTEHKNTSIPRGLNGYIIGHVDLLDNYECEECKNKEDKLSMNKLTRLGEVISVVFTEKYKEKKLIEFPQELRFPCSKTESLIYKLVAQCEHMGGQTGGHYNVKVARKNGTFLINDNTITASELGPTSNTYLVFYHFDKTVSDLGTKSSNSIDLTA